MKKLLYLFGVWALLLLSISCGDDDNDGPMNPGDDDPEFAIDIGDSKIPYIVITTNGTAIKNEPKIPAEMKIYVEKQEIQSNTIGIEYRGSTSFRISDKKSFGIEVWDADGNDMDDSFFNFPAEEDWILQGHVVNPENGFIIDQTLMYHYLGYELFREMGNYASRTKFVEIEINGAYLGVYVFMEKLKRDDNRINLASLNPEDLDPSSITGGYILKIDKTTGGDLNINQPLNYFLNNWDDDARYTENLSFRSNYDINGELIDFAAFDPPYHSNQFLETYFLYEYPKANEIAPEQKEYIQNYIHEFETALLSDDFAGPDRTYTDYIDMDSFVDFFLLNELARNIDGYRLSTFLTKNRGGKLNMGPVWDLNIGYDSGGRIPWDDWVIHYNNHVSQDAWMMPFWWPRLLEDPLFRAAVKVRWTSLRSAVLSTSSLMNKIDGIAANLKSNGAVMRNYLIWNAGFTVEYDQRVTDLKEFLEFRANWMDGEIANF